MANLVVEEAQQPAIAPQEPPAPGAPRGIWSRYQAVMGSAEFRFATATLVLTAISWALSLAGAAPLLVTAVGIAGALAGGVPIAWGAVRGILRRELNVDELVTIAIVASIMIGEYWGAGLVAFMMLFGKVLEDVTAARASHAIEGLGRLVPVMARVIDPRTGEERTVPVEQVTAGDVVIVRPGERLPVDGTVVAGAAAVEEAAITGESVPAPKQAGDTVYAGTLATGGALQVRTERTGQATALGRIAALVQEAESERAPIVRTADRWATWFTPSVLVLAGLVWLGTGQLLPAVTVLVVACPCALVLATPTAVIAGIAQGARRGMLIKGGARLEAAGSVDAVCLDKTGTLTSGRPVVQRVVALPPATGASGAAAEDDVLAYAAAAEHRSEHPMALAVLEAARARHLPLPDLRDDGFAAFPGRGVAAEVTGSRPGGDHVTKVLVGRPEFLLERDVAWPPAAAAALAELEASGQSPLAVAVDGHAIGLIGVADTRRPEAATAIAALRAAGLRKIVLLTGDRQGPALAVARAVGIAPQDVHAGLLPEEKVAWVKRLRDEGYRVAMVGDGVNDAPALATSDVAIAMGAAGTDLAMAAADVVLMTDDLRQAANAISLSRHTLRTIRQNLVVAAVWNALAIAVASLGGLGPVSGALVHNLGSVAVVVNAARLVGRD
ncbi:MAG TPA: cation-translocating P-type ATPase [Chloroflexota bacterium]|nr:cation-translocating P-type ATPase [Chloroflexota bacterium]